MDGFDGSFMQDNGEEAMAEGADEREEEALQESAEDEDDAVADDVMPVQKKYRKGSGKDVIAFGQRLTQNDHDRIWRMYSRLECFMVHRKRYGGMNTHNQRIRAIKYLAGYSQSTTSNVIKAQQKKQHEEDRKLHEEFYDVQPEPSEVPDSHLRVFGQPFSLAGSVALDVAHLGDELDADARQTVNRQLLGLGQALLTPIELMLPSVSFDRLADAKGYDYNILSEFLISTPGSHPATAHRGRGRPKGVKNSRKAKFYKKKRQPSFNGKKGIRTSLTSQRAAGLLPPVERPAIPVEPITHIPFTDNLTEPAVTILNNEDIPRNHNGQFVRILKIPAEPVASTSAAADTEIVVDATVAMKRGRGRPRGSTKKTKATVKPVASTSFTMETGPETSSSLDTGPVTSSDMDTGPAVTVEKRGRGRPRGSRTKKTVAVTVTNGAERRSRGRPRGSKTKDSLGGNFGSIGRAVDSSDEEEEVEPEVDSRQMSVWERALVDPLMISSHNTPAVVSSLMDTTMNAGRARKRDRVVVDGDDEDVMEWGSYNVQVMNAAMYADSLASCTFLPS